MAITDDLRKTFTDPTPLYFAAGTADLAFQQAKKVPSLVEQLRAEAPARIEAVRRTDPKAVQDRAAARARDIRESVQHAVNEALGSLDTDLKKLGESAQSIALRGVGVAFEYAVKARETYEKVAEHGEQTVRTWRGGSAEEGPDESGKAVGPGPAARTVVATGDESGSAPAGGSAGKEGAKGSAARTGSAAAPGASATGRKPASRTTADRTAAARAAAARAASAKKTANRTNGTKRNTPPAK